MFRRILTDYKKARRNSEAIKAKSGRSLEGTAERKVFSACVPAVEEILTFIPHSEWLRLRYVNKFVKRVVDRKLKSVETFPWLPKKANESLLDEAFFCVRNMTPNLKELPPFLEDRILLGGFTNVRRLTIRPERVYIYGLDAYVREIQERAPTLEYLKLQDDDTGTGRRLSNLILDKRCRFVSLREFYFSPVSGEPEFLDKLYFRLNNLAPNLEQLPPYLEDRIHLGGFPKIRRLTVNVHKITPAAEIVKRAQTLDWLKLESEWRCESDGMKKLMVDVFGSGCYFETLRKLDICDAEVGRSILPTDIISSLPLLEHISFPTYRDVGFPQDFQRVAGLSNLKILEGCAARGERAPPLPPILTLESVSFTIGNWNHEPVNDFD